MVQFIENFKPFFWQSYNTIFPVFIVLPLIDFSIVAFPRLAVHATYQVAFSGQDSLDHLTRVTEDNLSASQFYLVGLWFGCMRQVGLFVMS